MQSIEGSGDLDEHHPDVFLVEKLSLLLVFNYFLVQVSVICELHYDAVLMLAYHKVLLSMKASM